MGVSGSGKSTVAGLLAQRLGCDLLEGDTLHPPANIRRMSAGIALTDSDREFWLAAIAKRLAAAEHESHGLVVSCSALKRRYRDVLRRAASSLRLVYLRGDKELLADRLSARHGHFMPATLLGSQLADLEEPTADERAIVCEISAAPESLVDQVIRAL